MAVACLDDVLMNHLIWQMNSFTKWKIVLCLGVQLYIHSNRASIFCVMVLEVLVRFINQVH